MTQPTDPPPNPPPTPTPPAPAPAPPPAPPPQPVPAPTPAQPSNTPPTVTTGKVVENGEVFDFPEHTALASMTPSQQAEYWRHKARRHEDRNKAMSDYGDLQKKAADYDRLVAASQTEAERAVAEATRQGRAAALKEYGSQLVDGWVRVTIGDRLPEESVNALLEPLDRTKFLDANGNVDTAKVRAFVSTIAPAPQQPTTDPGQGQPPAQQQPAGQGTGQPPAQPATTQPAAPARGPDLGQGQPQSSPQSLIEAGRELARARFGKTTAAP